MFPYATGKPRRTRARARLLVYRTCSRFVPVNATVGLWAIAGGVAGS